VVHPPHCPTTVPQATRLAEGRKIRMRRNENPKPIWIKFCMVVDIPDVVTYTNFGDHRLRGFWVAGGQISPFPMDFHRRPYNTLTLPCECVIHCTHSLRQFVQKTSTIHFNNSKSADFSDFWYTESRRNFTILVILILPTREKCYKKCYRVKCRFHASDQSCIVSLKKWMHLK